MTKKKRRPGQPTKYKEEYCDTLLEFFEIGLTEKKKEQVVNNKGFIVEVEKEVATDLPLFQDFAIHIGVHVDTLHEWKKKHPKFSEAYKKAQDLQHRHLVKNSLQGRYQNSFAIFTAKNVLGWRDKQEHSVDGDNVQVSINYTKVKKD